MLSNSQVRNRIDAINELVANHRGDNDHDRYAVTSYDVVKKGFIPEEYQEEFETLMQSKIGDSNDSPLTLQEQLSYANYFAMHPEKICGLMEVSSSGAFPVKVIGKRQDVERVINEALGKTDSDNVRKRKIRIFQFQAQAYAYAQNL